MTPDVYLRRKFWGGRSVTATSDKNGRFKGIGREKKIHFLGMSKNTPKLPRDPQRLASGLSRPLRIRGGNQWEPKICAVDVA